MSDSSTDFARDTGVANGRRDAFVRSISKDLLDREDQLPVALLHINASPPSKLRRVYTLIDEIAQARSNLVACRKGCADCCRINISITKLEASQLSKATGRRAADIPGSKSHPVAEFSGLSCPFLVNEECSVYGDRPLSCRKHASYYISNWACKTDNLEVQGVPLLNFSGLDQALFVVSAEKGQTIVADIRDFFPPTEMGNRK